MSLASQISALASRIATEVKTVRSELTSGLSGKANTVHGHAIADVTNLQTELNGKAATSHNHTIANVTNLQSSLDAKANLAGGTFSGLVGFDAGLVAEASGVANLAQRTMGGFGQTSAATTATGWPVTTNNWFHLISNVHNNKSNYFAMQFAGEFFNSNEIYYRATNNSGTTPWNRLLHTGNANAIIDRSTNHSIVATDAYRTVRSTGAAITVTVDNVLAVGQRIDFIQDGTGQITFTPGAGVTLNSKSNNRRTASQYSGVTLICVASGQYRLVGDLVA